MKCPRQIIAETVGVSDEAATAIMHALAAGGYLIVPEDAAEIERLTEREQKTFAVLINVGPSSSVGSLDVVDDRTQRIAKAICARENGPVPPRHQCKTCRNSRHVYDSKHDCLGLGYEYLAEVAIKAADARS